MPFTQKYAIISPLESIFKGQVFESNNWPIHVTLADTFAVDSILNDFIPQLMSATKGKYVKITGASTAYFGKEKVVEVTLLKPSDALYELHCAIIDVLLNNSASFNDLQYTKSGYVGHVTKQKNTNLKVGESKDLNSIALIDMFPDGDPYSREVLEIFNINRN